MGAWDVGVFENDTALNWLDTLASGESSEGEVGAEIEKALAGVASVPDTSASCVALAAAEMVSMLRGHPALDFPRERAAMLLVDRDGSRLRALTKQAVVAATAVLETSELRTLWFSSENGAAWAERVHNLLARLSLKGRQRPEPSSPCTHSKSAEREWAAGDVLALPLGAREGVGYAQILSRPEMGLYATLALTTRRGAGAHVPLQAPLGESELLAVICLMFVHEIQAGTWPLVENAEPLLGSQSSLWPAGSPERCEQPDGSWAGLHALAKGTSVVRLMRAHHGLCPWPRHDFDKTSYLPYLLPKYRAVAGGGS